MWSEIGRYQKISTPIPRMAFRISEWGALTIMEFLGHGGGGGGGMHFGISEGKVEVCGWVWILSEIAHWVWF